MQEDPAFERLLTFLRENRAFDFTGYKRPSLARRVRYRMRELGIGAFDEYRDRLQLDPNEFTALFNTILIKATSFFRDRESWNQLAAEVLPDILGDATGAPIRVWSAGCASGQEAYSVAMLLHEVMGSGYRERVKIYATDVDEAALEAGREASYSEREIRAVPDHYRDRYFDRIGARWVVSPDLRRTVIFGRNDLTQDAPLSRIDLLLCRNTLIYFNAETRARVVSRLGFALRPGGVLFLGKAEMLLDHAGVFDPIDLKRRFFRTTSLEEDRTAPAQPRRPHGRTESVAEDSQLRDQLIMSNPVAQIAVDADGRLVTVNRRAAAMLGLSERDIGRPISDLEESYRSLELQSGLAATIENRSIVTLRDTEWRSSATDAVYLDVQLVPLVDSADRAIGASITFTDMTRDHNLQVEVESANRQLEAAFEELRSTNEELETTNQELQSTVEELETTNQELQAANDELQSINQRLRDQTLAVGEASGLMQAILDGLEIAVVVVDQDLVVQVWNTAAEELWGLRESETVGRHIVDLDSGMPTERLNALLRRVVDGQEAGVGHSELIPAINRRGRSILLRMTLTSLTGARSRARALVLFEVQPERGH
ncbi:PAS domain-containing protein [Microlunatus sp. Gsoil 973]|nr:PAS domain-containing protein [Microlunatus sp. Gsoil 973]